jgi:hypothetical protein
MAPPKNQTKENILPISNDNFFRHHHCPMRSGGTRCTNLSNCERVHFGDQAAPEKAVKLRDQIVQQINMKSFKTEASTPNSHVWTDIEEKVVMLLEWVLCKRHLTHCKAALQMTMRFLRQEIGMFVEEQSAQQQPQSREPATINNHSTSSESGPGAPSSAYASAASHLATPPMSPGTLAQGMGHQQHCFASQSQSLNDGAAFDSSFKPPQQSPFVFHANMPVKTEPAVRVPNIHSHRTSRSTTPRAVVNRKITSDANASKEQVVPRGFGVRKPSKTRLLSNNKSGKQPQAKPTNAQHPPNGPTVRPHAAVKASKHQQAKPEAPPGFTVRERSADRAAAAQPCLPETSKFSTSTHDKHRDSFDVAEQDVPVRSSRSEMDELIEMLKATELRNQELLDAIERLEDNNGRLLVANKQLLEAKKHYKELYQDAKDREGELEGENDGLEDELDEAREHIVKLEEELVVLRRPARGRSVRR